MPYITRNHSIKLETNSFCSYLILKRSNRIGHLIHLTSGCPTDNPIAVPKKAQTTGSFMSHTIAIPARIRVVTNLIVRESSGVRPESGFFVDFITSSSQKLVY